MRDLVKQSLNVKVKELSGAADLIMLPLGHRLFSVNVLSSWHLVWLFLGLPCHSEREAEIVRSLAAAADKVCPLQSSNLRA